MSCIVNRHVYVYCYRPNQCSSLYCFVGGQGFLWSMQDKHQFLEVRLNGTEIYYSGRDHQVVEERELGPIVRADRPIPRQGQFYFEVSIMTLSWIYPTRCGPLL